ncbi:hypothetical protein LEQ41_06025 [Streptococcus agalactiae]|nr:hypothetical protein [Streptococcus agalactiae]
MIPFSNLKINTYFQIFSICQEICLQRLVKEVTWVTSFTISYFFLSSP